MAAQYSNRQFFRKTPNHYLAQFFTVKELELAVNFETLPENAANELQDALNQLPDS